MVEVVGEDCGSWVVMMEGVCEGSDKKGCDSGGC